MSTLNCLSLNFSGCFDKRKFLWVCGLCGSRYSRYSKGGGAAAGRLEAPGVAGTGCLTVLNGILYTVATEDRHPNVVSLRVGTAPAIIVEQKP